MRSISPALATDGRSFRLCAGHFPATLGIDLLEGLALCGECGPAFFIQARKNIEVRFADIEFTEALAQSLGIPDIVCVTGGYHRVEGVRRPACLSKGGLDLLGARAECDAMGVGKELPDCGMSTF